MFNKKKKIESLEREVESLKLEKAQGYLNQLLYNTEKINYMQTRSFFDFMLGKEFMSYDEWLMRKQ